MNESRTKNTVRNIYTGFASKLLSIILLFASRTVIIYQLGNVYLGIGTLYTSILSFLSLAELGFSSAITYQMYKPIADKDYSTINALLRYYRKIYLLVGSIVFIIGICLIPALPSLVKGDLPDGLNIYILYLFHLINSAISYFFSGYRQTLLIAYQRTDITNKITMLIMIFNNVFQMLLVILTKNYYIYTFVPIIGTVLTNIVIAYLTRKIYPEICCSGTVHPEIRNDVKKKISGLFGTKLNSVVVHQADSIVISAFLGVGIVGIYGNYYYIMNAVSAIVSMIFSSMVASIGNKIATESKEENYSLFKKISFLNAWIVGWCSVCMLCLFDNFMYIWVGKKLMFDIRFTILLVLYFFVFEIQRAVLAFKDAAGLWYNDRMRPYVSMIINVVMNITLVQFIGIYGIVLSTIIAFLVSLPWANHVLFKHLFGLDPLKNLLRMLKNFIITVVAIIITYYLCYYFPENIYGLLIRMLICLCVPNLFFIIVYHKDEEFTFFVNIIKNYIRKRRTGENV